MCRKDNEDFTVGTEIFYINWMTFTFILEHSFMHISVEEKCPTWNVSPNTYSIIILEDNGNLKICKEQNVIIEIKDKWNISWSDQWMSLRKPLII